MKGGIVMPNTEQIGVVEALIGNLGFPIVVCLAMFFLIKYLLDKHREEIIELNEQHKEEMNKMSTALENNTKVMNEILMVVKGGVKSG